MLNAFKKLFGREYRTLNRIEISRSALIHNYTRLSTLDSRLSIAPVLKSNAYGHGIVEVSKILSSHMESGKLNIPFFCVDSLYEAYQLLKAGIKTEILIMGYTDPENLKVKKLPFQFVVFDLKTAEVLNKFQKGSKIHIFVDTGMSREGVRVEELGNFLKSLKEFKSLKIVGLMSHLASSKSEKDPLFLKQVEIFLKAKEIIEKAGVKPDWIHLSASEPLLNKATLKVITQLSNLARTGKALFGISPNQGSKLIPALKLTTKIIQIKKVKEGDRVGYSGTYLAKKDLILGVLPLGYNDGLDRRLSNTGKVIIKGVICPIIGRVSMNITTIDISKVSRVKVGDEVTVYSNNPKDPNSIQKVAELCKTIPHEILIREATSTKRVVVE
jgi:alanine racemase